MSYTQRIWNEAKHKRDRFGRFAKKFQISDNVHLLTDNDIYTGQKPRRTARVLKDNKDGTFNVHIDVSPDKTEIGKEVDVPFGNIRHAPKNKASLRNPSERADRDRAMKSAVNAGIPDLTEHLANQYGMTESEKGKYVTKATDKDSKLHADIEKNLDSHLKGIADGFTVPADPKDRVDTKNEIYRFEKIKSLAPDIMSDLNVEVDPSLKKAELDMDAHTIRTPPDAKDLSRMAMRYVNRNYNLDDYDKASNIPEFAKIVRELRQNKKTAVEAQGKTKEDLWEEMSMELLNSSLDLAYKFLWDSVIQNWFFSYFTWLLHSQNRVKRDRPHRQ